MNTQEQQDGIDQNSENLSNILKETLEVDEGGMNSTLIFSLAKMSKLGIKDTGEFMKGILDAKRNDEFNESNEDYIKGYKYGKTGKL